MTVVISSQLLTACNATANTTKNPDDIKKICLADTADFSALETIRKQVRSHNRRVDLRVLEVYDRPLTAADLQPLESQAAIDNIDACQITLAHFLYSGHHP
jgi:hypothetical protein